MIVPGEEFAGVRETPPARTLRREHQPARSTATVFMIYAVSLVIRHPLTQPFWNPNRSPRPREHISDEAYSRRCPAVAWRRT